MCYVWSIVSHYFYLHKTLWNIHNCWIFNDIRLILVWKVCVLMFVFLCLCRLPSLKSFSIPTLLFVLRKMEKLCETKKNKNSGRDSRTPTWKGSNTRCRNSSLSKSSRDKTFSPNSNFQQGFIPADVAHSNQNVELFIYNERPTSEKNKKWRKNFCFLSIAINFIFEETTCDNAYGITNGHIYNVVFFNSSFCSFV